MSRPSAKHREEHANTLVAQALRYLLGHRPGFSVKAETKGRGDRALPDFDVRADGLSIVMEAKYENPDGAAAAAQARFARMDPPPDIVGALSYSRLFQTDPEGAMRNGEKVRFAFKANDARRWENLWRDGTVYDLAQTLRRPRAIIAPQEIEGKHEAAKIHGGIAQFVEFFDGKPAALRAVAEALQSNFSGDAKRDDEMLKEAALVGGLILFGAFLFQFALSNSDSRVKSPLLWSGGGGEISSLRRHWRYVLDDINYAAVFRVALSLLDAGNLSLGALRPLINAADDVREAAGDGSDLMGRVYHLLLADAKTLAAFYTSIPAATLMAGLALAPEDWGGIEKWAEIGFIRGLRIADPACGSGTLLSAACWKLRDNFARADFQLRGGRFGGDENQAQKPMRDLQRALMEESIWGYDILETGGHLTATTLGLIAPEVDFKKAHIYRAIIGDTKSGPATGSLEMLESGAPVLFRRKEGQVETLEKPDPLPPLDLCIMNPPFVRGTKGNESYKFLPGKQQEIVHKRIKKLAAKHGFVHDGQGPGFVTLACKNIKEGGRLAMILPATFAVGMGGAWRGARETITRDFDLETLIVSREALRPNFSESTALQECICIARKRHGKQKPAEKALFVVLRHNPRSGEEALAVARLIMDARKSGADIGNLALKDHFLFAEKGFGEFAMLTYHDKSAWRGISFTNIQLAFAADNFSVGGVLSPFVRKGKIVLKPLGDIAIIGSNRLHKYAGDPDPGKRRVRLCHEETGFPGYYPGYHKKKVGVANKNIAAISEIPNCYIMPLPGREKWAEDYYQKSGRIVLNESFRFNTSRRLASLISKSVQASHYLPIRLHKRSEAHLKAMTLWLNSTPSVLLIANAAQSTHGAKVGFSQTAAKEMPVLDLDALNAEQIKALAAAFDAAVKSAPLLPLPKMENDPTRKSIDDAISNILGVGDFQHLRAALADEPIICGGSKRG